MQQLKVSANGRRLLREDGSLFFYLADTAWELFHRLSWEEIQHYLDVRVSQGFNVIQAVVAGAEFDGLRDPDPYGRLPFHDLDPTRPNEQYFRHVDAALQSGADKGLTWGLLPTWGDKWNGKWGTGPVVFNPQNAYVYGEWLGRRYRNLPLIWIVGGDRPFDTEEHKQIIRAMAEGLRKGDEGRHLITLHVCGGHSSSDWMHEEPWLDFNMLQTGHSSIRFCNHAVVEKDYRKSPAKPCLDGEPAYENHPDMGILGSLPAPYFDDRVVRRFAYQAVFAGACGHTYGCHDIWQFNRMDGKQVNRARTEWKEALQLPGAEQMRHLRYLMEHVPFESLRPCHALYSRGLASSMPSMEPVQSLVSEDRTTGLVYMPTRGMRTLQMAELDGSQAEATWFDPRSGMLQSAGVYPCDGIREWDAPDEGEDWVLRLQVVS